MRDRALIVRLRTAELGRREPELLRIGKWFGAKVADEYGVDLREVTIETEAQAPRGRGTARWNERGTRIDPHAVEDWR